MKYDIAYLTDVGLVRSNNEDCYLINRDLNLFIIADGMGGYQKGELASQLACEGILEYFNSIPKEDISNCELLKEHFKKAVSKANSDIRKRIAESADLDKMGSTVVAIIINDEKLFVANVGDSRAYLFRKNKLEQISIDHSLVQETKASGINKELASHFKNIITRAVGMKDIVESDIFTVFHKSQDKYLLCSDGLHGFVSDEKIAYILNSDKDIDAQMIDLIQAAKQGGGKDNITGIIISITESENKDTLTQSIPIFKKSKKINFNIFILCFLIIISIILCIILFFLK